MDKEINNQQQTIKNQKIQIADLMKENVVLKEKESMREKRWNKRTQGFARPTRTTHAHHNTPSLVQESLKLQIAVSVSFVLGCIYSV